MVLRHLISQGRESFVMYLEFFGLKEKPFNITPDPRFLVYTERHRRALDDLMYGIDQRVGFMELVGEVGSGKSTLCRALLASVPPVVQTALILNPCLDETHLLRSILVDLGVRSTPVNNDRGEMIAVLNKYLLNMNRAGRNVVVVIDEAQNLAPDILEQLRLLSNLETDDRKLMQLLLVGQPELDRRLAQDSLRQLRQRIMIKCVLSALTKAETDRYIDHRLLVAGVGDDVFFDDDAIDEVHRRAQGIPRLVNKICDRALLEGYAAGVRVIGAREVSRALSELGDVL
jgi:general secretion pathway protein A